MKNPLIKRGRGRPPGVKNTKKVVKKTPKKTKNQKIKVELGKNKLVLENINDNQTNHKNKRKATGQVTTKDYKKTKITKL